MTDPLGVAASAAAKIGSAAAAGYSRGRDERRQVYRRFQEAVVVYVMQIRDSRLSPEAMRLGPAERKPYIDALMKATTELAQALYEVRLVGNPGPVEAAEAVRLAINDSFDAAAARRENLTEDEADRYAQAMKVFTDACRRDLSYQPRWWQIWRRGWWRARVSSASKRQPEPAASAPRSVKESPQVITSTRPDVVFGGDGVLNNAGVQIVGTVIGFGAAHTPDGLPSAENVVQARDIHGVVFFHQPAGEEEPNKRGD